MTRLFSNRSRHFDMGDLPTELLARDAHAPEHQAMSPQDKNPAGPNSINEALSAYQALFETYLEGETAIARAPLPDDLSLRSKNLKACAYFLDATLAGVCAIDDLDGMPESPVKHAHALVFLVEFSREPQSDESGAAWLHGSNKARTDARATEVAVVLAGYLRAMGYNARGHVTGNTHLNLEALAQRAGIARSEGGVLKMPFLQRGFAIAAVSTDLPLEIDLPIAAHASLDWPDSDTYMGKLGTRPGWAESEAELRPLHLGRYPMESLKRVPEPATLILRDEIIRNSKRADLFTRALAGDLGEKAKVQRTRFATKHPLAFAMTPLIRDMVPLQGTYERLVPAEPHGALSDAQKNAESIKALAYFLGADLVGICEAEPWMFYSHEAQHGKAIEPTHKHCIVMLLDQGFETMEGASGDDWISGAQSMRSYMRGAFIAGVMGAHLRRLGFSSRAHTNAESDVLHIPATLLAGLGELSRIGELVLNPFIGPRSKSVLLTTDLPLVFDQPIDFGLQSVCNMCLKCARECPCNAIPFGPKVMFNGYEIWKPDVEKCGKYRLTNMKGSACGRCMKTCPYNREDLVESSRLLELSIQVPSARRALIDYDDQIGAGMRNAVKRWWFDLEIVNGVCVSPSGVNERDLDLERTNKLAKNQKLAFFPPHLHPRSETTMATTVPLDREAGLEAYANAEKPSQARKRKK
ncbi:reductive dehalogenase domain-containing protein [Limnohabitans sp. G3-2]|uniref:reductive dehalogenase domain-containing protein n=1 Tax=Limnohabitans sp. G3-2 TaxID=1100711 RepID=UPI000C1DEA8C|nr:reductive dehalogenase domain-containing protein [Limnohabitans sp. G3-2]PIT71411.1 Fe-S protein [Limnohabitans sp. G3-2]